MGTRIFVAGSQNVDRISVGHVRKRLFDDRLKLGDLAFFNSLIKELHILFTCIQAIIENTFQEILGQLHVVGQVKESCFRFDHPEFCEMPTGIAVFGAKRWSKCINSPQSTRVSLCFKLSTDRQKRRLVKKS